MGLNFRWNILKVVVLSALFGFISGILGGLIIASIYAPIYGIKDQIYGQAVARTGILKEAERAGKMHSALVSFYVNRQNGVPVSEDRLGYGTTLTTDGWIVTTQKVLRNGAYRTLAVAGDRRIYTIEKIVSDPFTNVVFVRLKAERMPVLGTASAGDLPADSVLGTADANRKVYKIKTLGIAYANGEEDNVQSSEKLNKFLFVSSVGAELSSGGPLINNNGEIVGIVDDAEQGRAIPFEYVDSVFRELLKSGKATRPYLGVNYLDLGSHLYLRKDVSRGAEITPSAKARGVLRSSPAANIGIVEGDIILKIDDVEIGYNASLSEVVSQYQIGSAVSFVIRHGDGKEETKGVVFAEKP